MLLKFRDRDFLLSGSRAIKPFPVLFFYLIYSVFYITLPDIGLGVRVFANGPEDLGSIPGRVIPKTQKMVLDASLLNTQHYKVRIKGKVEQSREGVAPSPTHWCCSYRKGSLRVTLDYGRQLYFIFTSQWKCIRFILIIYHSFIYLFYLFSNNEFILFRFNSFYCFTYSIYCIQFSWLGEESWISG